MNEEFHKWSQKYDSCLICGTTEKRHFGKGLCITCYQREYEKNRSLSICDICNNQGRISKVLDNLKICRKCYQKHYRIKRECDICHSISYITTSSEGKSICQTCYRKLYAPKEVCSICHSLERVASRKGGKIVCTKCYKNSLPSRVCSVCNTEKQIEYVKNGKYVCSTCYNKIYRPKTYCSNCGKLDVTKFKIANMSICPTCYDKYYRPTRICSICGKKRIIKKIIDNKSICDNCYINYAPKRTCSICQQLKPIKKKYDEKEICGDCYLKLQNTCSKCGHVVVSFNYTLNICDNCAYKKKVIMLTENIGNKFSSEEISQLYKDYIFTLIKNNYAGAKLYYKLNNDYKIFKFMEENGFINANEKINELINKIHVPLSIQNYFYMKGILKVESDIDIFTKIHFRFIDKVDPEFNNVFTSYSLSLIEIKRKFIDRGWNNKFSSKHYFQCLRQACLFFKFLCKNDIKSINELNQNILDEYVLNSRSYIFQLKKLIIYINKNMKLFRTLTVQNVKIYINLKNRSYSQNEQEAIFNLLNSSETNARDKIIGFLVLVYGIKISEIVNISFDDIKISNNKYYLYARNTWITLNDDIGKMIWTYIKNDRKDQLSLGCQKEWLFTGSKYYKPIGSKYISSILTKFGIFVKRSFPTLFKNYFLNYDISPSLLIRGLGMNIATTINYYNYYNINGIHEINVDKDRLAQTNNMSNYIVYILSCSDGTYYTGYTSDLQKRLKQHQRGTGCTYTKTRTPVELVYTEELPDKPSALKREKQIKKLTIFDKEKLIKKSRAN